jgi:hypothetical protein
MKAEDGATAGVGIQQIRKSSFDSRGLIEEGQGPSWRGKICWKTNAITVGLEFDFGQWNTGLFASTTPAAYPST